MNRICEKIKAAKYVWIYGAGEVANRVLDILENPFYKIDISGIVVSNSANNPERVRGYNVYGLDKIQGEDTETVFIVAVSKRYQSDVLEELHKRGFSNIICWYSGIEKKLWGLAECCFEDRAKDYSKVCFVLSGYKQFLWDDIFERLVKFIPEDVEVCLLSSGKYDDKLSDIARENAWSYLSTTINSVTLIQNIAYELFDKAEWIYKMDEDMFLTEGCFEHTMEAYKAVEENEYYRVGFAAPLINLNGYSYVRLLQRFGLAEEYTELFERPLCGGNYYSKLEYASDTAPYMWGLKSSIPQIDELNRQLGIHDSYSICSVRFSIGFILFNRSFWNHLGLFKVTGLPEMGEDEERIGSVCMNNSFAIAIAENSVVGHFSFGRQTEVMKEYYEKNREWFKIH